MDFPYTSIPALKHTHIHVKDFARPYLLSRSPFTSVEHTQNRWTLGLHPSTVSRNANQRKNTKDVPEPWSRDRIIFARRSTDSKVQARRQLFTDYVIWVFAYSEQVTIELAPDALKIRSIVERERSALVLHSISRSNLIFVAL